MFKKLFSKNTEALPCGLGLDLRRGPRNGLGFRIGANRASGGQQRRFGRGGRGLGRNAK